MEQIKILIEKWKTERLDKIELASVYARNPIVHKYKAPHRSLVLRELVFWRIIDLLEQILFLEKNNHILGARILLRSAYETLGILIYLNQKTRELLDGIITYNDFEIITNRLILGNKKNDSGIESINIITVLEKCNKKYPGIFERYKDLSESAHPNFEGMCMGFSEIDNKNHVTYFRNRWKELYYDEIENLILTCTTAFEYEYNDVWQNLFELLEKWIMKNEEFISNRNKKTPNNRVEPTP